MSDGKNWIAFNDGMCGYRWLHHYVESLFGWGIKCKTCSPMRCRVCVCPWYRYDQ